MALIKCHECGEAVSDHSRACPKCGARVIATINRPRITSKRKSKTQPRRVKFVGRLSSNVQRLGTAALQSGFISHHHLFHPAAACALQIKISTPSLSSNCTASLIPVVLAMQAAQIEVVDNYGVCTIR